MIQTNVDDYLRDGCGRCEHFKLPSCKVHLWTEELVALRALVRASGLDEEVKWGSPCYTLGGKNVAMIVSFRDRCALQLMKGAALADDEGALVAPGESSRYVRLLEFRSMADVKAKRAVAKRLLDQAIALERAGGKVEVAPAAEPVPDELAARLAADPALRRAFDALTPGRRRSHILHVAGAKQSETRARRVDKCAPEILAGRGWNER